MRRHVSSRLAMIAALLGILPAFALSRASEYLGNNQRDGFVDASIPTDPVLLWTYQQRHPPKSAWPEPYGELQFIDFDPILVVHGVYDAKTFTCIRLNIL